MRTKIFTLFLALLVSAATAFSQSENEEELQRSKFQFTFLTPPISTNGSDFFNTVNEFSINLFIGASAGTHGFEAGGFININKYYIKGAQFAGFMNIIGNTGDSTCYKSEGSQFAGFANINNSASKVFAFAGFTNIFTSKLNGALFAGFANFVNKSENASQIAGFANISTEGNTNVQIGGFVNVAEKVDCFQAAGFINIAKVVKGSQISGFINICDSISGIPIGFISIVRKNGYRKFEIATTEHSYLQFSYKMGVKKFYNIYTIGKLANDSYAYTYGGGFGSEFDLDEKSVINIELTCHQIIRIGAPERKSLSINRTNMLNRLSVSFGRKINDRISLFAAPSFNCSVSTYKYGDNSRDFQPYWDVKPVNSSNNTKVRLWAGFTAGIRF